MSFRFAYIRVVVVPTISATLGILLWIYRSWLDFVVSWLALERTPVWLFVVAPDHSPFQVGMVAHVVARDSMQARAQHVFALQMFAWFAVAFRPCRVVDFAWHITPLGRS